MAVFAGNGVKVNKNEAVKYFQRSADLGDADAQYNLAWCFRCARPGSAAAWLGLRCVEVVRVLMPGGGVGAWRRYGHGVERNNVQAVRLYRAAADQGNVSALYNLGSTPPPPLPLNHFIRALCPNRPPTYAQYLNHGLGPLECVVVWALTTGSKLQLSGSL